MNEPEKATFLVSHFHYAHDYVNKGCGLRFGSIRRPSCGIIMSSVAVYDLRIGAIAPAIKLRLSEYSELHIRYMSYLASKRLNFIVSPT
ncbi:hypothetical protein ACKLNR_000360 [Fusarium oxysporum f. sp. zingiberi]